MITQLVNLILEIIDFELGLHMKLLLLLQLLSDLGFLRAARTRKTIFNEIVSLQSICILTDHSIINPITLSKLVPFEYCHCSIDYHVAFTDDKHQETKTNINQLNESDIQLTLAVIA